VIAHTNQKRLPPYVSYRTFLNFIGRLERGIPARIDRSYWGDKWSGSTGTQLMGAVRFLGLVDTEGVPTDRLRQLVSAQGAERAEILRQINSEAFDLPFQGLDPKTATYAQLEEFLRRKYGLNSGIAGKCIRFLTALANDAGIPLSPFVTKKSKKTHASAGTKKPARERTAWTNKALPASHTIERVPDNIFLDKIIMRKFPPFDPNWSDEVKVKWFEALDELLKRRPTS
jgi:antitoxin component of RelBE/YafQ-DinJ toxin-antitoxin module